MRPQKVIATKFYEDAKGKDRTKLGDKRGFVKRRRE